MVIKIHFDGACHNIPGENNDMGVGVAVFFDDEYQEEYSQAKYVKYDDPFGTSNIAEWTGCVMAMKSAFELKQAFKGCKIEIYSDSQLISYQYNGKYAIKKDEFKPFHIEAKEWGRKAQISQINWIKREYNEKADELSKIGLHELSPKLYWFLHDESDSCFTATRKHAQELQTTCPSDLWEYRAVKESETENDADAVWEEINKDRKKLEHV